MMRTARARRARAIAEGIVTWRANGGGYTPTIPERMLLSTPWRVKHLYEPVVRRSLRLGGLR